MNAIDKLHLLFDEIGAVVVFSGAFISLATYLARTLGSGVATLDKDLQFRRVDEPREYWILVSLCAAATIIVAWLDIRQL
nr:hypothetical protein [uncultured Sphingosinicella sp.]